MIDLLEARNLALKKIEEIQERSNVKLGILDTKTVEFKFGWMFFYQSQEYINTGKLGAMVGGNAPLIVDKYNSSIHVTGTGRDKKFYISKYCEYRDQPDKFKEEIRK